jgi:nicotinate-nucleotide pyrophosphorylase (carboxylating)
MSGIASLTESYVDKIKGTGAKIVDTRKTAPGLRFFDKYAVRTGGGYNHRSGLFDGVLVKDNHIAVAGGVRKAVRLARLRAQHMLKVEVEVKNISQVKDALTARADMIMLDNMSVEKMKKAVEIIHAKNRDILIEASGNITLDNVNDIAKTGVNLISVGALTHSAPAADISMDVDF